MIDLESVTPAQERLLKRIKSRNWVEKNFEKIQEKYADKWIAVVGEKLVANGKTPEDVKEKIKGEFPDGEVIFILVPVGEISKPA